MTNSAYMMKTATTFINNKGTSSSTYVFRRNSDKKAHESVMICCLSKTVVH